MSHEDFKNVFLFVLISAAVLIVLVAICFKRGAAVIPNHDHLAPTWFEALMKLRESKGNKCVSGFPGGYQLHFSRPDNLVLMKSGELVAHVQGQEMVLFDIAAANQFIQLNNLNLPEIKNAEV